MRSVMFGLLGLFLTTSLMAQEVQRIEIQPGAVEASIGDEIEMSAIAYDEAGNIVDTEIQWFTSYEIGTMLDGGVFLATNTGEAIIGAIAAGKNTSVPVRVGALPPASLEVVLGVERITATSWLPLEALAYNSIGGRVFDADIAWRSSDESVASVVGGFLVGHRPGTVQVSASAGEASADARMTVVAAPACDLTLDAPAGAIRTGDVYHLAASVDGRAPRRRVPALHADRPIRTDRHRRRFRGVGTRRVHRRRRLCGLFGDGRSHGRRAQSRPQARAGRPGRRLVRAYGRPVGIQERRVRGELRR